IISPIQNTGQSILNNSAAPAFNTGYGLIGAGQGIANNAASTLQQLLTPGANMTATLSQIPGFQFAQDWGQQAARNQGTSMGLGGNTLTAGANYATGLAQQGYGNIVNALPGLLGGGINYTNSGINAL